MILLYEHIETMQELTDEEFGSIVRALYWYELDGTEPEFSDRAMRMMWSSLKSFADTSYQNMQAKSRARSEAGKKGNAKRWGAKDDIAKIANATDAINENRKNRISVSVSESVSVSNKEISPIGDKEKDAAASHSPAKPRAERFHPPEPEEVRAYFAEKGGTADQAQRFRDFYESNGWRVGKNPMKSWKAAASGWIARDREKQNPANMPRGKAFLNTRPPEEAAKAGDFLADAARRRPLKKKGEPNAPIQSDP